MTRLFYLLLIVPTLTLAQAPDTLQAYEYYLRADSLEHAYDHDRAFALYHRAAGDYHRAGAWNRYVCCLNRQSYCQRKVGRYRASLALAQYALRFSTDSLGMYHAETAEAYARMGNGFEWKSIYDSAMLYYKQALLIREKVFGAKSLPVASSLGDIGGLFCSIDKYDSAIAYCRKALINTDVQTIEGGHCKASVFNTLGNVYLFKSQNDSALFYYKKSLHLNNEHFGKDHPQTSVQYANIGGAFVEQRKYEEARKYFGRAISVAKKGCAVNNINLILPYEWLGILSYDIGYYDSSLIYYKRAYETLKSLNQNNTKRVGTLLNNMGAVYSSVGLEDTAFSYYQKVLTISKAIEGESGSLTSVAYYNLGESYETLGAYGTAIDYYQKALDIDLRIFDEHSPDIAINFFALGSAYYQKKDYTSALSYLKKALNIYQMFPDQSARRADISYYIGLVYSKKGAAEEALSYYREAIQLTKLSESIRPNIAYYYQGIGDVYSLQKNYEKAVKYYEQSLRYPGNTDAELQEFNLSIAKSYHEQQLFDSAIQHYQQSISANVPTFNNTFEYALPVLDHYRNAPHLLTALHGKATTFEARYQQQNRPRDLWAALEHYRACDTLIAAMQHQYLKHSDRVTFGKTARQVYEGAVRVSLKMAQETPLAPSATIASPSESVLFNEHRWGKEYYTQQAFYYAERAKAGALTLALADRRAKHFAGVPESLLAQEKQLKQERTFYQTQLQEARAEGNDPLRQHYEDRLFTLNRSYDSLIAALERQYPRYYGLKYTTSVQSPRGVQQHLDERTAFLEYAISDTVGYVFSLTRYQDSVYTFAVDSGLHRQLRALAHGFAPNTAVGSGDSAYAEAAYRVYQRILSPALAALPSSVDRLIIVPDGQVSYLPFDMLPTEPVHHHDYRRWPYLLRQYAVSYAYSATLQWPSASAPANALATTRPRLPSSGFSPISPICWRWLLRTRGFAAIRWPGKP